MKTYILPAVLTALTLVFSQCSKIWPDSDQQKDIEKKDLHLPMAVEQFGKDVAEDLRRTVVNLHRIEVDYSDADASETFYNRFMADYLEASPNAVKTKGLTDFSEMTSPDAFVRGFKNLTKIQLKYIDKIIIETAESESYADMRDALKDLSVDIQMKVPDIQQERLLNIISVLYYSSKELQYLEEQGLMPRTPRSALNSIKTRSELISDSCRKFLAATWAIAVGEPTPTGEIVASVVTVYIGAMIMYEVIVCKKSSSANRAECQDKYYDCVHDTWDQDCSTCLQYCITQGYWPQSMCSKK